tara:strand:+ start:5 stop:529 length:525 start_codon:yes stop_codon:yes gene_type:complete
MAITRLGGANAISGTIPAANVATLTSSNLPAGSVIQVKHGSLGAMSTTATSYSIIGSISITPTSASNKVFIMYENHEYIQNYSTDAWRGCLTQLLRDSTTLITDNNYYGNSAFVAGNSDRFMNYTSHHYLDSPNTTNAITYQVDGRSKVSGVSASFNISTYGMQGRITVMEIKG